MSAIFVQHVSRWWGVVRAVDDVSFETPAGRMVVLLGPSGCGKSTTLRLIAGLEAPTSGRILIGDRDVTHLPPAQRGVSMVFQSYALFPHLSVAENIVFGLRVRKLPGAERAARLARVAALLGLGDLLHRKPSQLSGGQQQRVALGRALVAETPVCLMDEPLSNLDAQLRLEMRREIRSLQQSLGITMVYVTHDQSEAMSMADQVILLREGRVEQDGTPAELYARPATAFTARFIGTPPMNVLRLADSAGVGVIAGTDGPPVLSGRGAGLLVGVRPEDIGLAATGGLPAVVNSIEYLGADSIVSCAAGGQAIAVRAPRRVDRPVGTHVHLTWAKDAAHVFDATSGRRRDEVPVAPLGG
ncbi:MAG TPA: ABC transporter ATP-binding protein [Candidatus Methylomirabilis sp.]|nr:ABC transporter ATP-binding protein [Candidatus Methylomirabilis sp.]